MGLVAGGLPVVFDAVIVIGVFVLAFAWLSSLRRRHDRADDASELLRGRWECESPDCRAINPRHARYCRRCGRRR